VIVKLRMICGSQELILGFSFLLRQKHPWRYEEVFPVVLLKVYIDYPSPLGCRIITIWFQQKDWW